MPHRILVLSYILGNLKNAKGKESDAIGRTETTFTELFINELCSAREVSPGLLSTPEVGQ